MAEHRGKLVGFARAQFWDGAYFVREVFVASPFRKRGVGSKFLASCEDFARKKGETSIYLTVEPKHQISLKYLICNGYDTLNMLELRKDLAEANFSERQGEVKSWAINCVYSKGIYDRRPVHTYSDCSRANVDFGFIFVK